MNKKHPIFLKKLRIFTIRSRNQPNLLCCSWSVSVFDSSRLSPGDGTMHCPIPLRSHSGLNIQWEDGTLPSFPSLQSGGNWVLGSPKWYAIFTTLCSIWGLLSRDLLPAVLPKPRNLTLGQLSPDVMENIWPAAWLQGSAVQPQWTNPAKHS